MVTKGTAWLIRRSTGLVPALLGLAPREWLTAGRGDADGMRPGGTARDRTARGGNPPT